ncbi:hypothetical protein ES288_A05G369700v1 [Gossypium darwinii]|uniref:Uncharacterized protein n=1 Tax=Gossypium darwinii TaxID=34276 RepID=A0A5D2GNK0_GOSDA|nr:hypothetical protein ES288_A05G369700v1 [Gossypium darwinii]
MQTVPIIPVEGPRPCLEKFSKTAIRRSDPGDVETERGNFSRKADLLVPFWLTPEASGILMMLR